MAEELNLENLKVGDEITTITPLGKGFKYGWVYIITEWDDKHKRCRLAIPSKPEKNHGWFPLTGYGYYFMSKREKPDFFYSANPKHIEAAKKAHEIAKAKRDKEEAKHSKRIALASPIGVLLGSQYNDSYEDYTFDSTNEITEELVRRLTDEQIITLKGWLGL